MLRTFLISVITLPGASDHLVLSRGVVASHRSIVLGHPGRSNVTDNRIYVDLENLVNYDVSDLSKLARSPFRTAPIQVSAAWTKGSAVRIPIRYEVQL